MKKVLILLLAAGLLVACGDDEVDTKSAEQTGATERNETPATGDTTATGRSGEIEKAVESKVKKDYSETSINEIKVNEDMGTGEGYIVLAHLSFDRKNRANTAKDMITMYAQDLGATLADQSDVNEVTVFFEVPYLKDGNIYKINMQRSGNGMAIKEEWFDNSIFD